MATLNFNAETVEPNTGFDPIPAGKYLAVITNSEMKPTKQNNGEYLELTFEIIDGQYKARKVWSRLTLAHPNQQAVTISRGHLSAICRAVGVLQPNDSCELHDRPLTISVKCSKRTDTGDMVNEVSSYAPSESAQGQPTQAATNTPPWRRS